MDHLTKEEKEHLLEDIKHKIAVVIMFGHTAKHHKQSKVKGALASKNKKD